MTKKRGLRAAQLLALTLVLLLLCACGKVDHNEDETSNLGHWGRALAALSMQTLGGNPVVFGGELPEDTVSSALEIREIETREISGSLACDGYASSLSALFGCPPVTSFSQNVGLINMTKVVNRFTIMTGAVCMILAGLLPPVGNFFASLPDSVLGGCTLMMFGTIMVSGIQMISKAGFSQRNVTIVALSLAVGIGFTSASEMDIWRIFPQVIQDVFSANCVAVVFVVSIVLSLILPQNMEVLTGQKEN